MRMAVYGRSITAFRAARFTLTGISTARRRDLYAIRACLSWGRLTLWLRSLAGLVLLIWFAARGRLAFRCGSCRHEPRDPYTELNPHRAKSSRLHRLARRDRWRVGGTADTQGRQHCYACQCQDVYDRAGQGW